MRKMHVFAFGVLCAFSACATAKQAVAPATSAERTAVKTPDHTPSQTAPAQAPQAAEEPSGTYDYLLDAEVPDGWIKHSNEPIAGVHMLTTRLVAKNPRLQIILYAAFVADDALQLAPTAETVTQAVLERMKNSFAEDKLSSGVTGDGEDRAWAEVNVSVDDPSGTIDLTAHLEVVRVRPEGANEGFYVAIQGDWYREDREQAMAAVEKIAATLTAVKAR